MTIRAYIAEQPAVVARVFREFPAAIEPLTKADGRGPMWLVGSGSSKHALIAARPLFRRLLDAPVRVEGPLAFTRVAPAGSGGVLAVVLSQIGTSTTSIAALRRAQAGGFRTFALTAEPDSPFGLAARALLPLPIGAEAVGPKTKGYTASIAALTLLAHVLAGRPAPAAPDAAELAALVAAAEAAMAPLADPAIDHVMVMGQGRHRATALEGSLKVAEMSGVTASAHDTEEAFHGRFHGLTGHSLALFVAADADEAAMAAAGAECLAGLGIGARVLDLSGTATTGLRVDLPWPAYPGCPELDLIAAAIPFQWLAVLLAEARGMKPEAMRYPDLTTRLRIKTEAGA